MKIYRQIIGKWLVGTLLCVLTGMAVTGCSDDFAPGDKYGDLGEKVHGTVSVPVGTAKAVTVSRALDFGESAQVKIDSYWVALFDTKTRELIGSKYDTAPRKSDGTRYTLRNDNNTPFTVDDIDIYYYELNPEVYVVGVVNYNNVNGKMAGDDQLQPLLDLLTGVGSFDDFCKISVDTYSADRANTTEKSGYQETPLMMGFYSARPTDVHTTVTQSGDINGSHSDVKTRLTTGGESVQLAPGAIQLQRLMAEINVTVRDSGRSRPYHIVSVEYMVCNSPREVFLAEHTTDVDAAGRTDRDDFLKYTANSADYSDNYTSDVYYTNVPGQPDYDDNGVPTTMYRFSYQHYENKHWGDNTWSRRGQAGAGDVPSASMLSQHAIREAKYDKAAENAVFKTLCPGADEPWNNNASYMVLKVEYEISGYGNAYPDYSDPDWMPSVSMATGTAYYTIHEGYICAPDGSVTMLPATKALDYQTVRNTTYTYDITINGINDLLMNAYSDESGMHNDGVTGSVWDTTMQYVNPEGGSPESTAFQVTREQRKQLQWVYGQLNHENGKFTQYGRFNENSEAPDVYREITSQMMEDYFQDAEDPDLIPDELLNALKIVSTDGTVEMNIKDFIASDDPSLDEPERVFKIKFEPFRLSTYKYYDREMRMFYLYFTDKHLDEDGCGYRDSQIVMMQSPLDERREFPYILLVSHDEDAWIVPSERNYYALWGGAMLTVDWLTWRIYDYDPSDYTPETDPYNMEYYVEINNGSTVYDSFTFNARDYYDEATGMVRYPYYVSNYDMRGKQLNVYIEPVLTDELVEVYRPEDAGVYSYNIMYVMNSHSQVGWYNTNSDYFYYAQWQFNRYSSTTELNYSPFFEFYGNSSNYRSNVEFGGMTVVNGTASGSSGRDIVARTYNSVDYLRFGGAGTFNDNPDNDKLVLKFWVDRPGCVKIWCSYPSDDSGTDNKTLVIATRDGTEHVELTVSASSKGERICKMIYGYGQNIGGTDFTWGTQGIPFEDGPKEIGIYSKTGAMCIHAVQYFPYDIR